MKKKIVSLIITILLSFTVTGCSFLSGLSGGGNGSGSSTTEPEKQLSKLSTQEVSVPQNKYISDDIITIKNISNYKHDIIRIDTIVQNMMDGVILLQQVF